MDKLTQNGLGWIFDELVDADLTFTRPTAMNGGLYFKLSKYMALKQTISNAQNNEE